MIRTLKFLAVFVPMIFLVGCFKDHAENAYPYYEFNDGDKKLLIQYNYLPEEIITYENQIGEKLHFKVISNETKKIGSYSGGTFSGGSAFLVYYFDMQIIRIEIAEGTRTIGDCQELARVNYIFHKDQEGLHGGLHFPMWNTTETIYHIPDEPLSDMNILLEEPNNSQKEPMTINGHLFKKVVTIHSGTDAVLQNQNCDDTLNLNVDQISYDYGFGIVQFKDINDNIWKVIYP